MVSKILELWFSECLVHRSRHLTEELNGVGLCGITREAVPPCLRRSGYAQAGPEFPPPPICPLFVGSLSDSLGVKHR